MKKQILFTIASALLSLTAFSQEEIISNHLGSHPLPPHFVPDDLRSDSQSPQASAVSSTIFASIGPLTEQSNESATDIMSLDQKKAWIQQLDSCQSSCRKMAMSMLQTYAGRYPDAVIALKKKATFTMVYLHSFSLTPGDPLDGQSFLQREYLMDQDVNIIALPFTAHNWDSKPKDFMRVTPDAWETDSELALKLAHALGLRIVVKGNSLGGLMATYLDYKFPNLIDRLVLTAPAVMITHHIDNIACAGRNPFIKGVIETFDHSVNTRYLAKYLNGACPLSRSIISVRSLFDQQAQALQTPQTTAASSPEDSSDDSPEDSSDNSPQDSSDSDDKGFYPRALQDTVVWAQSIKAKTLMIYSEADDAVDVKTMRTFANNLPNADVIAYDHGEKIDHLDSFQDMQNGQGQTTFNIIDSFMRGAN